MQTSRETARNEVLVFFCAVGVYPPVSGRRNGADKMCVGEAGGDIWQYEHVCRHCRVFTACDRTRRRDVEGGRSRAISANNYCC